MDGLSEFKKETRKILEEEFEKGIPVSQIIETFMIVIGEAWSSSKIHYLDRLNALTQENAELQWKLDITRKMIKIDENLKSKPTEAGLPILEAGRKNKE